MEVNLLSNLPFYGLTHNQFNHYLRLDKYDILNDNSELAAYIRSVDANRELNSLNFSYVNDSQFNNMVHKEEQNITLSVFHINIRSLNCNHRALVYFLEMLVIKFDVVILSEVWDVNIDFYRNILDDYTFCYELPKDSHVGGIGMYIKNTFLFQERSEFKLNNSSLCRNENIWYEILGNGNKYIIGAIYRHPNQSIKTFIPEMEAVLGKLSDQDLPCIIAGDINIDLTKCSSDVETANYVDQLLINNFIPVITMPTRITSRTATLIDHMYYYEGTKHTMNISVKSGNFVEDISDHLPNYMLMINKKQYSKTARPLIRLFSERNMAKFKHELQNTNWSTAFDTEDINQAYENFINLFTEQYNRCFILTRLSRKRSRDKPWITSALKKSSRKKTSLYKRWIKTRSVKDEHKYKNYKKIFVKLAKEAEVLHYKELFDVKANSIKNLWSNLNKVCSFKKSKNTLSGIQKLVINNKEITEKQDICNELNKYFATIGENLVVEMQKSNNPPLGDNFRKYCDPSVKRSMFCEPVDRYELKKILDNLKPKSPGSDGIRPKIIKEVADSIIDPLLYLFNLSICSGKVPDNLKIAKVTPLYKKGEHFLPGNYRPISLLNVIDKILEKIMYTRLYSHLQTNSTLYDYQFGFRKNYSTILALLEVTDSIYKNLDEGNLGVGIYLDLQKAFDTVNHDILLYKLYNYGVRGIVHDWFRNYLTNRQQFTQLSDIQSPYLKISCGVPQGSVLGPLLFLIYVNDIGNAVPSQKVKLFADDTNLFVFGNKPMDVELDSVNCINALNNWFVSNKLTLNFSKTCYMIFSRKKQTNLKITVSGHPIENVSNCKYLGVLLDSDIKWVYHINSIYSKLIKFTSIFYKLRDRLPKQILKQIYFAFVHPHILYGIELYANTYNEHLDKLIKLNNKLLRILQNKPISFPVYALYRDYNTLPIPQLHKLQLLLFVHKYFHHPKLLPGIFLKSDYFQLNEQVHTHYTRNISKLHLPSCSTSYGCRNIKYKAAVLWNNLPKTLIETHSYAVFKRLVAFQLITDCV